MNIGIIAATPLQVLNIINLCTYEFDFCDDQVDLFFQDSYCKAKKILEQLIAVIPFENVYSFDGKGEEGVKEKKEAFWSTLFPDYYLKKHLRVYKRGKETKNYQLFLASFYTVTTVSLLLCNPGCKHILYEDGCGSYRENGIKTDFKNRKRVAAFFGKRFPEIFPLKMYLNNPTYFQGKSDFEIQGINNLWLSDIKQKEKIYKVFSYQGDNKYTKVRIVYLSQPDLSLTYGKIKKKVEHELVGLEDSCVIRCHPLEDIENGYKGFKIDRGDNLWELICLDIITDNHILVGDFSTAHIMPKIIFDKEPWLVFTVKKYLEHYGEETVKSIIEYICFIKKKYRKPEKVIIVENDDELASIITRITRDDLLNNHK